MTTGEQIEAARQFILRWRALEKQETQRFWISLLSDVLGISNVTEYIEFEKPVKVKGQQKYIDAYIKDTRVLIEQKGGKINLDKPERQSDGEYLTPYEQAVRYDMELNKDDEQANWIVVSNFYETRIYNRNDKESAPQVLRLANLQKEYKYYDFLIRKEVKEVTKEQDLSVQAGEIVGKIYDALKQQYKEPDSEDTLKSLNALCVRLVFCMYAEDAGIFGTGYNKFSNYMGNVPPERWHRELKVLFQMLNTPDGKRDGYDEELEAFPFVNGGLFNDDHSEIPAFTQEIVDLIIKEGCKGFNWRDISPTIFGAVFESTLNQDERRERGMHFTPIENIHKVIDPLFLDDLKQEFEDCKAAPIAGGSRTKKLKAFQDKLASLNFLDPACGSGNFLTESYLCIRRLENEVINILKKLDEDDGQTTFDISEYGIKVSIEQFHGIEINDFAVAVAKTAMWIAEAQMLIEAEKTDAFIHTFLPLTTNANIVENNALTIDWNQVVPKEKLNFIMGNPPFSGARLMKQGSESKQEIENLFGKIKDVQDLDYVTGWYKKAATYIQGTDITVGLVSTNSICQGSQVPILWDVLLNQHHIHINYAHQTFKWQSETRKGAAVFCVIVGFSAVNKTPKQLFCYSEKSNTPELRIVQRINPYLIEGEDWFVHAQKESLCDVPKMNFGNQPRDGGFFILSEEERTDVLNREPELEKWIRQYVGADEFIKGKTRYCFWLKHASPSDIKNSRILYERVENVKAFRLASRAKTTNGYAKVPHLFAQITQPDDTPYLLIPRVSSEQRRIIPIGFMDSSAIASDAVQIVPNATLYHFGVLTSNVHMAWMRTVAGRLEMRYRYSKELVYNTFPWPEPDDAQRTKIEQTAQAILDVRAKYPEETMAALYDRVTMPKELEKVHADNNRAVMRAYGFDINETSEADCVKMLMARYKSIVEKKPEGP